MDRGNGTGRNSTGAPTDTPVVLRVAPERRLIRPNGSWRHVLFTVEVGPAPVTPVARPPLALALVLDRSGSMAGEKFPTARRAAQAVLDRLDETDRVAVVIFDDQIDVLQAAAPATAELKRRVTALLAAVEARGSTALHQGWLTGCLEIASDQTSAVGDSLARCFLLTDGLANVGLRDPEAIASEAAGVRQRAGVSTSTFGIGADYDEGLLGPLAVAGGGQFHHLRAAHEIASTFVGELGGLFQVAARGVCLEIAGPTRVETDVVSEYWATRQRAGCWTVAVGDLGPGETRPVVARFWFPPDRTREPDTIQARLVWQTPEGPRATVWETLDFMRASDADCNGERADRAVLSWVGRHHADRAEREAARLSREGNTAAARALLATVRHRIAEYAGDDPDLLAALAALAEKDALLAERSVLPMEAKEWRYQSQRRSRFQPDYRSP